MTTAKPIKYVYVAGPYTQGDVMHNIRASIEAASELLRAGLIPFCPHLTGFWHFHAPEDYNDWLAYDLAWLHKCDALLRLPGPSSGADNEVVVAKGMGIPVYNRMEKLLEDALVNEPQAQEV